MHRCWLNIAGSKHVWVTFKYEKIPDLCFVCGCLNHMKADCAMAVALHLSGKKVMRNYEKGIRTDGLSALSFRSTASSSRFENLNFVGSLGA